MYDCVQKFKCHRALLFKNFIHRKGVEKEGGAVLTVPGLTVKDKSGCWLGWICKK